MGVVTGLHDHSGAITAGTTAQDAVGANLGRQFLLVQNLDAAEDLWVNFGADAAIAGAGSILLKAGTPPLTFDNDFCPSGRVSVNATTTGHKFTVKDG